MKDVAQTVGKLIPNLTVVISTKAKRLYPSEAGMTKRHHIAYNLIIQIVYLFVNTKS